MICLYWQQTKLQMPASSIADGTKTLPDAFWSKKHCKFCKEKNEQHFFDYSYLVIFLIRWKLSQSISLNKLKLCLCLKFELDIEYFMCKTYCLNY